MVTHRRALSSFGAARVTTRTQNLHTGGRDFFRVPSPADDATIASSWQKNPIALRCFLI